MYNFIDTNEVSEGNILPSEALQINGEYIENLISGYRTLNVTGREALSPELAYYETGARDGSKLKKKRYPSRTIIVRYQLIAKTNEEFREAYNKLGAILDVEDAELIFNDEQDKFYIGTPAFVGEVEAGRNAVVGEIEIFCADPFKYSVIEYEAEPWADDKSTVLIDYNGTYKAYPILEADFYSESEVADDGETATALTGAGDCGFVAFFNENENIIQLGDPLEVDGANDAEKSQTLINQLFLSNTAWGTTAKKLWTVNSGIIPLEVKQEGTVAMAVSGYEQPATSTSGTLLKATSTAGKPTFNYTLTAKSSNRTASSVKVDIAITTSLAGDSSYFGKGYGLTGSIYIGGAWRNVTLKKTTEYWEGRTGHTANYSYTVTGLSNTATSISGIKFKVTRSDSTGGTAGVLSEKACSSLPIVSYAESVAAGYYLTASNYGSSTSGWHGPSIIRNIGADASGEIGAANFTFTYQQKMSVSEGANTTSEAAKEIGGFHCHLSDDTGKVVAGVRISKNMKAGAKNASIMLFVNGEKVYQAGIDLSYNNKSFGTNAAGTTTIKKAGALIDFDIAGLKQSFKSSAIADTKVTKVTFMFEKYSTSTPLGYNGLYTAKFIKNNCSTFREIPNKFSANDIVEADCKNGEIYLNGLLTPSLGALGNDWENFYLKKGLNQIGITYSEWVNDDYAPTIKVRYREVFL